MSNLQNLLSVVQGEYTGKPLVAPFGGLFPAFHTGVKYSLVIRNPDLYVDCEIKTLKEFQYDAVWGPSVDDISTALGVAVIIPENGPLVYKNPILAKKEDLAGIPDFEPARSSWTQFKTRVIKGFKKSLGDFPVIVPAIPPFRMAGNLFGLENLFISMIAQPSFVEEVLEFCFEQCLRGAIHLKEMGADILWFPLPIASADLISRQHYHRYCHPLHRRFFSILKSKGIPSILHTCGEWEDRFDLVAGEGANMLHVDGARLPELVTKIGCDVGLMGQVSTNTLARKTPQDVYSEALQNLKQSRGAAGFVLGASCDMPPLTPRENLKAMIAAARDFSG